MVKLQGDKAEDLALLLNYLYNPTQMSFKRFDPNTPLVVPGVIRLADKYCIEALREHLIKVVVADWPTSLQEWDVFQIEIQAVKERLAIKNGGKKGPELEHLCNYIPEPASAIVFAQEFGCPEILPAAYYQLLSISPHFEWDSDWKKMALVARWSLLDRDTLLRCMKGFETVICYRPTPFQLLSLGCYPSITYEDEPEALRNSPCYSFLKQMIGSVWDSRTGMLRKDPLDFLSKCLEDDRSRGNYRDELCDECCASLPDKLANLRQKLWNNLCHITLR